MAVQFGRRYQIQIFDNLGNKIFGTDKLQIAFEVQKTIASVANQARITLINLSEAARNRTREPFNFLTLKAGYEDLNDVIFTGDIKTVFSRMESEAGAVAGAARITRKGTEMITEIEAGDGTQGLQSSAATISLPGGTPIEAVIKSAIETMPGIKIGILKGLEGKSLAARGISFTGSPRLLLKMLGLTYNFSWSIQDGLLETLALESNISDTVIGDAGPKAYVISESTGMIGMPELLYNGKIKARTLLNPRIKPGRSVNIRTTAPGTGFYKVLSVTFKGDFRGNDWYTDIEALPLNWRQTAAVTAGL
jgi:hypothetical protein